MPNLFIVDPKETPERPPTFMSLVFWPNFRFAISSKRLFLRAIMEQYQTPFFTLVGTPEAADFVAVPFEYFFAEEYAPKYLATVYRVAEGMGKKVLLFDYTDYADQTPALPSHAILFRVSAYRHHKRPNELIMPYFVEDMRVRYGIGPKDKGEPCVVGYCGQSRFASRARQWHADAKWLLQRAALALAGDAYPLAHTRGIFWRARALQELRRGGLTLAVIERSFYSLHRFSAPFGEEAVRREYVKNLRASDLALCIRGDANASQRFYEALSASRVPLFLDTDCVLPLEEIIPYDDFILRVSAREFGRLSERVHSWETAQTPASFLEKERSARRAYENYLRLDRFFALVFDRTTSPYKHLLYGA